MRGSTWLHQAVMLALSMMIGGGTYLAVKRLGTYLVVNDAHLWGTTVGIFTFLSQFLFLNRRLRKARGVGYKTRLVLICLTIGSLVASGLVTTKQIKRGYPILDTDQLSVIDDIIDLHFTVKSDVNPKRAYKMSGNLGHFYLVPALNFDGHVLLMLPTLPESKSLIATGKLRSDIRTVLTSKKGEVQGPFLQVYREDMKLPENTRVVFLDTSNRAGLNFTIVIWLLLSAFLLIYCIRLIPNPVMRGQIRFKG